jgi:hypothetical protein
MRLSIIGFLLMCLAGCANGFLSVAESPAQKGYGIERAYNILLEDALQIASAASTSASTRQSIQSAEARATPIVDSLSDALARYEVERARFDAGQSTAEQVTIAVTNLERWLTEAQAALVTLQDAFH